MTKKTILIRNVDKDLWNWFAGYCKQKGKSIGETINSMISKIKR